MSARPHLRDDRNTDNLLSKLLFKTLSNDLSKSPSIHLRFSLDFDDRFVAAGKVGDDRWNTHWDKCAQGEAVTYIYWPACTTFPTPPFCSAMTHLRNGLLSYLSPCCTLKWFRDFRVIDAPRIN